jgi:hypothetical protein
MQIPTTHVQCEDGLPATSTAVHSTQTSTQGERWVELTLHQSGGLQGRRDDRAGCNARHCAGRRCGNLRNRETCGLEGRRDHVVRVERVTRLPFFTLSKRSFGEAPNARRLFLGVPVGCGGARRVVHQFEFLAAAVAVAVVVAAASAVVRRVSPALHSPWLSEASLALNRGRSVRQRRCGPLRHARANASDH